MFHVIPCTGSGDVRSNSTYEEADVYSRQLMTIRQTNTPDFSEDMIELTPPPPTHDYSNIGPNGTVDPETTPIPVKPRPPVPSQKPSLRNKGSPEASKRLPVRKRPPITPKPRSKVPEQTKVAAEPSAEYDDPNVLGIVPSQSPSTEPGTYDDINEIFGPLNRHRGRGKSDSPVVNVSNGTHSVTENVYDPVDPGLGLETPETPLSPKFDDTIYNRLPGNDQAAGLKNMGG